MLGMKHETVIGIGPRHFNHSRNILSAHFSQHLGSDFKLSEAAAKRAKAHPSRPWLAPRLPPREA